MLILHNNILFDRRHIWVGWGGDTINKDEKKKVKDRWKGEDVGEEDGEEEE